MRSKKIVYSVLIMLVFAALILALIIVALRGSAKMEISFLNVGQGDAILIENGNRQILIDSGKNGRIALEKLGEEMPFWDRNIELIILTHPDLDHYGGLKDILDYYKVESVFKTEAENDSQEWQKLKQAVGEERATVLTSTFGSAITFPNGAKLEILYPFSKVSVESKDKNDVSVVAKLEFGQNKFLFTGDLSLAGETELVDSGADISADVLKIGHHGSKSSTSSEFLQRVNPSEAVISVGVKNTYGHPHSEVLDKLRERAIKIWRTDQNGTIKYRCKSPEQSCDIFVSRY